ncbi:P-loop containing nucleoside triphosphate hydrolase protein [Suillus clintonianus]|uniref:P-loop containing nucleoside triphosphate hydrolase protein n=1 Tax=Suillus clintonianus TaxID=1904413 RepID=UPI001B862001|nr:P-loop containing nucleoside triphosphate hydrolase protein [Suillus clintonianus]KAG2153902.1 P-loop containing nucleoside triphosphate hydrolase protein [Suillus clintonianus]
MVNIVIFGEIGTGKSSVINLMAGRQIAHISPDARRCTLQWTEYPITFENGTRYQVFDTVGLEEPRLQTGEYLSAISNAHSLINTLKERGGVNLLLFCIRGGRVTATMQSNYRLFFEFLCEENVPLALVVTNLERETIMEDWYTRNMSHLEKYNIRSTGHACITAANLLDGKYRDKYEESRAILCGVVEAHCNAPMEGWTGGQGWLASSISKLVEFVVGRPKKTDIIGILTKRCGMTKEMAQQKYQSRPQNVVLWGESGVGKSSLINLIMGRDVAETSPDALSCTVNIASYQVTIGGRSFRLWDTAGLNEGSEGKVPAAAAARRLTLFLDGLNKGDGVHLFVYCVRGTQATKALRNNYQTFSSAVGDSKVPTVIVATCLEDLHPMTKWWSQNKDQLAKYGMHFSGCACVTTLPSEHAESQDLRQRRAQSYEDVCKLILDHCSQTPHNT